MFISDPGSGSATLKLLLSSQFKLQYCAAAPSPPPPPHHYFVGVRNILRCRSDVVGEVRSIWLERVDRHEPLLNSVLAANLPDQDMLLLCSWIGKDNARSTKDGVNYICPQKMDCVTRWIRPLLSCMNGSKPRYRQGCRSGSGFESATIYRLKEYCH
jgi:hypothetical protein